MEELILKIQALPIWSIYVIYIISIFILLKIFFKILKKTLLELDSFVSLSSANEKLYLNKVIGYVSLFLLFIEYCFFNNRFDTLGFKIILIILWLICLIYIKSSLNLFDHIISLKYTPHLLDELEYTCLSGEIIKERGCYYLDSPFLDDKLKL